MEFITVSFFFIICMGLGYAAVSLVRPKELPDTILLSLAVGLGIVPLVILVLRILHIPLDFRILLGIALALTALGVYKQPKFKKTRVERYVILAILLVTVVGISFMMYKGATTYPHLEDDDPWAHAEGARYVALEKTTLQPYPYVSHYLEPYPPYFTAIMGILHQSTPDLRFVLKFFNALIVGLSILCAFFAFEALLKDSRKALIAAVLLGMIPAYMSHFIWSQTLAIPVFFMGLWAIASVPEEKKPRNLLKSRGLWLAVLLVWSATIIQPSTAAVAALLFVVYALVCFLLEFRKRIPWECIVPVVGGGILSFLTWLGFTLVHSWERVSGIIGIKASVFAGTESIDTSAGQIYSFLDIVIPPSQGKIDQATGLGWLVCLLVVFAVFILVWQWRKLFTKKNEGLVFSLVFLIIGLLGIEGNALPIRLFPHRFWVFLAIPVAILAAEAIMLLANNAKKQPVRISVAVIVTVLVLLSIAGPRVAVQQANWPPGAMWSFNPQIGFIALNEYAALPTALPLQTRIFPLCSSSAKLIGFNMGVDPWNEEYRKIREQAVSADVEQITTFMQVHNYGYLLLDGVECVNTLGQNETAALAQRVQSSERFQPVMAVQQAGFLLLQLR